MTATVTISGSAVGNYTLGAAGTAMTSTSATATAHITQATLMVTITGPAAAALFSATTAISFQGTVGGLVTGQDIPFTWTFDSLSTSGMSSGGSILTSRTLSAGVYQVTLTVNPDGANANYTTASTNQLANGDIAFVVVYDPNGGFVTGGGWIMSPARAYAANLLLTVKANFGFVSKYKKGQSIPTGETQFQFHAAGFNFHSTAYDWLVIAGPKAQYKGTGTVNGSGEYGFLLTATDGQINGGGGVDKFRIKVWDKGTGVVVYDNNVAGASDDIDLADPQAISGGSIVIHK